ncbi:MAG: hypothetical protein HC838_01575 [Spirulinaceae cyanobacterium RM2_2_10]|nr:hypothetical protein [Spirulinaceae cyanobacterium RM2_2_10]
MASSSPPESPAPLSELNPAAWLPESASCPLPSGDRHFVELTTRLRQIIAKHHLRLEWVSYPDAEALDLALLAHEVHGICTPATTAPIAEAAATEDTFPYRLTLRIRRLYEIVQAESLAPLTTLTYARIPDSGEVHS